MEVGTRVEIVKSGYDTSCDVVRHLRDGNRGVIVEVYEKGLLIVKVDNDQILNVMDGHSIQVN